MCKKKLQQQKHCLANVKPKMKHRLSVPRLPLFALLLEPFLKTFTGCFTLKPTQINQ